MNKNILVIYSDLYSHTYEVVESKIQKKHKLQSLNLLQGAKPPLKDIFISRVSNGNLQSIKLYLKERKIDVDEVFKVSHDN